MAYGESAISVIGENFIEGSILYINGLPLSTIYGSKECITALVPYEYYDKPGLLEVQVKHLNNSNEIIGISNSIIIKVKKKKEPVLIKNRNNELIDKYQALIGEFAWHSLTVDSRIENDSKDHFNRVMEVINKYKLNESKPIKILEVAAYAHTTGYMLRKELSADVTLLDISASTLKLGRRIAAVSKDEQKPKLVAGDFHNLPFKDDTFDFVYISAALHHTWRYQIVGRELQRVLTPGGILYIMGEPCLREACFYKFRANRPNYTQMEQKMNDLGILRFAAEQFTGSRPEYLFGMVENMQMPLQSLHNLFSESCDILEITLNPEYCMGKLENDWLNDQKSNLNALREKIINDLISRFQEVSHSYNTVERGLGFNIPSDSELYDMGEKIALKLHQIGNITDQFLYRMKLSELFGANLQIIARKRLQNYISENMDNNIISYKYPIVDGVELAYPKVIADFLIQNKSLIPDLIMNNQKILKKLFPENEWLFKKWENADEANIERLDICMKNNNGHTIIPAKAGNYLIMFRLYVNSKREFGGHYRFVIKNEDEIIYSYSVYQSESLLFTDIISHTRNKDLILSFEVESIFEKDNTETEKYPFIISYAGAFCIQ